jgi:ABC-type multidrug transport system fused ATPase/permease subunit
MSPPGRPKGESLSAQREGSPVSPPGRPKGESLSAQREGSPVSPPGRPKGEPLSAQREGSPVSATAPVTSVERGPHGGHAPILDVEAISTYYGASRALFDVSLQVGAGQCVALLGRNGVGKSTVMRSIMGLTPPAQGAVRWKGQSITGWRTDRVARAGIGFVPEDRRVFAELTVRENLDVARRAAQRPGRWTIEAAWDLFPKLATLRERRAGFLSGGEQQMLTIARTLMCNPELRPKAWRHWSSTRCSSACSACATRE